MHTGKKCTRCKEFKDLTDFPKKMYVAYIFLGIFKY